MNGKKSAENVVPTTPEEIEAANEFLKISASPADVADCLKYLVSAGQICWQKGITPRELARLAVGVTPALVIDGICFFDFMAVRELENRKCRETTPVQHQASDAELRWHAVQQINSETAAKANAARG